MTEMAKALPPEVLDRARAETVLGRLAEPRRHFGCRDVPGF